MKDTNLELECGMRRLPHVIPPMFLTPTLHRHVRSSPNARLGSVGDEDPATGKRDKLSRIKAERSSNQNIL